MNAPAPEGLVILGSTGSIGKSTLDVVARHAERYRVVALAARRSWQVLAEQCRQFRPEYAVVTDPEVAASLSAALSGLDVKILVGAAALDEVAALPQAPIVMAASRGFVKKRMTMIVTMVRPWSANWLRPSWRSCWRFSMSLVIRVMTTPAFSSV